MPRLKVSSDLNYNQADWLQTGVHQGHPCNFSDPKPAGKNPRPGEGICEGKNGCYNPEKHNSTKSNNT